jgi:hypothetical membrane protein
MQAFTLRHYIGAGCLALGGLLYLLAERVSALAWRHPGYRYSENYISDLGIPGCGAHFCSPLYNVMNAGFATEGLLFIAGALLLYPWGKLRVALLLAAIHGMGGVLIALFHSGGTADGVTLHQIGAVMAIGGGNLCLIAVGLACVLKMQRSHFGYFSLLSGAFGLACMLLIPSGLFPVGLIERAAVYPITLWQIVTGIALLISARIRHD